MQKTITGPCGVVIREATDSKRRMIAIGIAGLLAVSVGQARSLVAQQPGFTRVVLQEQRLSVQDRRAVVARAEFESGAAAGRHSHPGEELGYVLEGSLEITIEGQPPMRLKPGDTFFIPAGAIHDGRNVGSGRGALVSTFFVEPGKPLAISADGR